MDAPLTQATNVAAPSSGNGMPHSAERLPGKACSPVHQCLDGSMERPVQLHAGPVASSGVLATPPRPARRHFHELRQMPSACTSSVRPASSMAEAQQQARSPCRAASVHAGCSVSGVCAQAEAQTSTASPACLEQRQPTSEAANAIRGTDAQGARSSSSSSRLHGTAAACHGRSAGITEASAADRDTFGTHADGMAQGQGALGALDARRVQLLAARGACVHQQQQPPGLQIAGKAGMGRPWELEALLRSGAATTTVDMGGLSPMHACCSTCW